MDAVFLILRFLMQKINSDREFYMKKIAVVLMTILLLTVTLFRINSAQLLKKLTLNDLSAPVTQTMVQTKLKNQGKGERRVRIVILNESTSTPYYSSIKIKNQELSLSYGKKLSGKKKMNGAEINPDSKYFKKNSVVKIEAPKQIELERERENRNYPGSFYIYKTESGLVLVNDVDLEQYVAAVISSEIGVNAPKEALNAQAVCARTYIINQKIKNIKNLTQWQMIVLKTRSIMPYRQRRNVKRLQKIQKIS